MAFEPKSTKYKIKPIHFSNYFENNRIRERERGKKEKRQSIKAKKVCHIHQAALQQLWNESHIEPKLEIPLTKYFQRAVYITV